MTKLTDTQTTILRQAATRPNNLAMPLPNGLAGAAAKASVTAMIKRGWLKEVTARPDKKQPLWREAPDGSGITLVATKPGLRLVGKEPASTKRKAVVRLARSDQTALVNIRQGTKQALLIDMLQRPDGASISEIVEATSWQAHTARGAISGGLKKKLGLPVSTEKCKTRGTVYRLGADAPKII